MAKPNYKQVFAIKNKNEEKIKSFCPNIKPKSGIYWFYREDENGIKYGYIGKAGKNICSRMADHFSGFQHIDLSIKRWGMYDAVKNPYGYKCGVVCYCRPEECDEKEQFYIKEWANRGIQLRNVQSGGSLGRTNIADNRPARGYRDGLVQGELNLKRKLNDIINKYLTIGLKKEGKLAENALNKFWVLLSEEEPNFNSEEN